MYVYIYIYMYIYIYTYIYVNAYTYTYTHINNVMPMKQVLVIGVCVYIYTYIYIHIYICKHTCIPINAHILARSLRNEARRLQIFGDCSPTVEGSSRRETVKLATLREHSNLPLKRPLSFSFKTGLVSEASGCRM